MSQVKQNYLDIVVGTYYGDQKLFHLWFATLWKNSLPLWVMTLTDVGKLSPDWILGLLILRNFAGLVVSLDSWLLSCQRSQTSFLVCKAVGLRPVLPTDHSPLMPSYSFKDFNALTTTCFSSLSFKLKLFNVFTHFLA